MASTTDGLGYRTAYTYDAFGDETGVRQQLSRPGSALSAANSTLTTYAYDIRGEQVAETDAAGTAVARSTRRQYDAYGRVVSTTDGNGHTLSYVYDALGREVSVSQTVGGAVRTTRTAYDAFGRVVTQTDALGNATRYQYDLAAHTTIVTTPDGVAMTTVQDAYGDTVSVTDGAGNTTRYSYDADGRLIGTTDALGHTSSNQYDADGHQIETVDASGRMVAYGYDAEGRVLSRAVDPNGLNLVTRYAYDGEGRTLSVTDPAGSVTTYAYDADGNVLTQVQDAGAGKLNLATTYSYDGAGKTLTVTQGAGTAAARTTQYVYDARERLSQQIVDPAGLKLASRYTYDANDQLTSVTDANGAVTRSVYDAAGEPVYAIAANGAVTQTTYDADGRVTATHAYATALSAAQLGALGSTPSVAQVAALLVAGPDDAVRYTVYDAAGKLRYSIDPMGYVSETRYDAAGRVSETLVYAQASAPGAAATAIMQGQGSASGAVAGLLAAAGNSDANARASLRLYDADGRLRFLVQQTANGSQAQVGETRYDADGRVVAQVTYGQYLALNPGQSLAQQLTTLGVAQALAGAPAHVSSTVYDQAGRSRYSIDAAGYVTETGYDADGRAVSQTAYAHSIALPASLDEAAVAAALAAAGTAGARIQTTRYDAAGRILATADALGTSARYTYDATGLELGYTNRDGATWTYAYDHAGRKVLEQSPAVAVASVDGNGNVVDANASLFTAYQYDHDGNVVAISRGSGAGATSVTWLSTTTYAYDAVGHQVRTTYPNGATTQVIYDALGRAVADQDADGHWQYKVYDRDGQQAYGTYTYNERNDVVVETEATVAVVGANGQSVTTAPVKRSAYDIEGNLVASIDENGNAIRTSYNALGQKTGVVDGAGAITYTGYDGLGRAVASQDGNGNIHFTQVDALGRAVQAGEFIANAPGTRQAVWQQAYVLDQNGDRLISYDGIGSAALQGGNASQAALHASYAGYDSQGRVIWSQDAAQRAASVADAHGPSAATAWTQQVPNADFSQGSTGWVATPGWEFGNWNYDGQNWGVQFGTWPNNGSGTLVSTDRVPVVPGQVITASGNTEVQSDHGWGKMQIYWYDAHGNLLAISDDKNSPGGEQDGSRGAGTAWVTGTAPAGAAFAAIAMNAGNYNEGTPGVTFSQVWWNYVPPAGASSLGPDGSVVVWLPSGHFSQQPTNQDFEQGDTGWDKGTGWRIETASSAANGSWLANYNGVGAASLVNQDRVPVTPGQVINASVQVSLYLAADGARAAGAVLVIWYDASGKQIGYSEGNVVYSDHKGAWKTSSVVATAPPGAAYASIGASASANGIGNVNVDAARWDYQYIAQAPTGVVQDTYVYNRDGELVSKTTADRDTESWQYNAHGQVIAHTDLSGAQYTYAYDAATGAEIGESDNWSPTAQGQQAPAYVTIPLDTANQETLSYLADGQLASERFADGSVYTYQYDASGDLVREEDITRDGNGKRIDTVTQTTYDSHHRISQVVETDATTGTVMLTERFGYDAAGNRREVSASSRGTTQDAWYTYDGDNRVAVGDGSLVNGQIVVTAAVESSASYYDGDGNLIRKLTVSGNGDTQSQTNVYDARDALVQADYAVDVTRGGTWRGVQETVSYDADGHALVTSQYYALGTTLGGRPPGKPGPGEPYPGGPGAGGVDVGGELSNATVNFYDAVGRLSESQTFGQPGGWTGGSGTPPPAVPDPNASSYGSLTLQSEVVYQGPSASPGYDADGDVVAYQYRDGSGRVDQYQVTYLKKDGYLQAATSGVNVSGTANVQPATDASVYDSRGDQVALEQHAEDPYGTLADTVHVFATNGSGEIIERQDGTGSTGSTLDQGSTPAKEVQHYVYVNGQQLAHMDDAGTLDVLDQVTAFSSNNDSPDNYVVQAGDTLESIAQAEYGDASLWYVLAQANDLSSDTNLALGQRLAIPTVTTHSNSATTFKPYDPSAIVGSTTPSLPSIAPPPPPSASNCNPIAEIVVIAAIVVATVFTAGAAAVAFGAASGSLWAAGTAALAGSLGAEGVAAAAIGGFVGNAVGQLTGDAEGISHGFSFGAALEGGLTAGLTAGIGYGLSEAPGLGTTTAKIAGDAASTGRGLTMAGEYAMGAASYAANVVGAKLTEQPTHFSWAGFVASGVAQGIVAETGLPSDAQEARGVTTGSVLADVAGSALSGGIDRELSVALGDNHVAGWASLGENAVGHAAGNALGTTFDPVVTAAYQAAMQSSRQTLDAATQVDIQAGLAATQAKLNAAIWRNTQTAITTQLNSEGQSVLDAAWTQTEARLDAKDMATVYSALGVADDPAQTNTGGAMAGVMGDNGATPAPSGTGRVVGFPVMLQGDSSNPADVAQLQTERENIIKFLSSQHWQLGNNTYAMPPEVSDFQGLIDYGKQLSLDYHDLTNQVTVTAPSELQADAAAVADDQQASDAVGDQLRNQGNIGYFSLGDVAANALHLLTFGGNSVRSAMHVGYDMVTDRASAEQVYGGLIGMASSRPIDTYRHAVDATSNWMALPPDEQARSLGEAGASFLAMGGIGEGAGKLVGYAGDLAGSYRSLVNAASFDGSFLEAPQGEVRALAGDLSPATGGVGSPGELANRLEVSDLTAGGTSIASQSTVAANVASDGSISLRPVIAAPEGGLLVAQAPLEEGSGAVTGEVAPPSGYAEFTPAESQVIDEAQRILGSSEFAQIGEAHAAGEPLAVNVGGRMIQYEPGLPASGMTMFGENGFLVGPEAFASQNELQQTVLHELYRLTTSASAEGVSGTLATQETQAAADFAARASRMQASLMEVVGGVPDTTGALVSAGPKVLRPEYLPGFSEADILSIPKGARPDPSTYLTQSYQDAHAALFQNGAVRIQPNAPVGTIGRGETWVFPKSLADDVIANSGGDVRAIEKMLGLDDGYLGSSPVRVDIPNPSGYRIPTGNEFGANSSWRPGGVTWPGGLPEAVIDPVPTGNYLVTPVFGD